jgi:hypothetical protein
MSTPRFLYHASAVALTGEIRRPYQQVIECQATTALPRYGGRGSSSLGPFEFYDILSHSGVASEASGVFRPEKNHFETTAQSSVKSLSLRGIVTVESLNSRVQSTHPGTKGAEPSISIDGSEIKGLRIAGRDIQLEPRLDIYKQLDTMTKLRDYYRENAAFRQDFEHSTYVGEEASLPEDLRHFFPWRRHKPSRELHHYRDMTMVPLYTIKNPSEPGFEVYGNAVKIADFGKVHIGELIIEPHRRRVLMLHVEMGSPVEGYLDGGCSDGNGSGTPPPDNGGTGGGSN